MYKIYVYIGYILILLNIIWCECELVIVIDVSGIWEKNMLKSFCFVFVL